MSDYVTVWSGALYKSDEARHSLTGSGWQQKHGHILSLYGAKKGDYPTQREVRHANLIPADGGWSFPTVAKDRRHLTYAEKRAVRLEKHKRVVARGQHRAIRTRNHAGTVQPIPR